MRNLTILVIVLGFTAVAIAGSPGSVKGINTNSADQDDARSPYALIEPYPVFDCVNTPPASSDLPKEITLIEAPAQDCSVDRVIFRFWLPMFLLKSGF